MKTYYWPTYPADNCTSVFLATVIATTPWGREIIEYTDANKKRALQYPVSSWMTFKYFEFNGEVLEMDADGVYFDGSFCAYDRYGTLQPVCSSDKFTPISAEEAVEKAVYFLNLNPEDPWPLSKGNAYWCDTYWSPVNSFEDLGYGEEADEFVMIPFSEIKAVLKSFGVTA